MPESRVELRIEVETEGAEQLTALRSELDRLGTAGREAFGELDVSVGAVIEKLKLSRNLVAASTENFLQSQRQLFAGLSPLFDSFFRGVFAGSRSLRDALKRLWRDFLDFFLGLTRRMVAAWISGQRQMQQASAGFALPGFGGGGGLLGGILGSIGGLLGLPGLGIPSGTPPTFPSLGLGLLTGRGGFPTIGSTGGVTGGVLGQLGGLGGLAGLAGLVGLQLLAGGGRARGFLGGFLTGGGFGTVIGSSSALAGTAIGAFAGPIGAIVGAIAGGIAKIFKRGKIKRRLTRVAVEGFAEMHRVVGEFLRFRVDFESAVEQLTHIWEQMVNNWSRAGSLGRRAIRTQQPQFEALVRGLVDIQRAREQRTQLIGSLPIPEFQFGGLVRAINTANGRILAFLHGGEAVLNRRAVQALGERRVEELNRAPSRSFGSTSRTGDHFSITIQAVDAESVERWLQRNEGRLVRFIRRAARDRGREIPF